MDVFDGPGGQQIHDHNPGVSADGLFWTMPIPPDSVGMNLGKGTAAMCISDAQMPDLHDLATAVLGGGTGFPLFPSTVSMEARWFNAGPLQTLEGRAGRFRYRFRKAAAWIRWRGISRLAMFASDDGPQRATFAAIGVERNGRFLD